MAHIALDKSDTAYILVNGPSVSLFKDYINCCKDDNVYWCGINRFKSIEENILSIIDEKFDILYCSSYGRIREFFADAEGFQGVLIVNSHMFVRTHINYDKVMVSDWGFGYNSLVALTITLAIKGIKRMFLFGADGCSYGNNVYYCQDSIKNEEFDKRKASIARDTEVMNRSFWRFWEDMGAPKVDIYNVSIRSNVDCFPKITYPEFLHLK